MSLTCRFFVWQVTLFTRGKAPITQQLPGESDEEFADYSSKVNPLLTLCKTPSGVEIVQIVFLWFGVDAVRI